MTGDDPLGLIRADDFGLQVGSPLSRGKVDLAASQLRAGYDSAGYSDARVTGSMAELGEGGWKVTIHVEPGGRRKVREVEIVGLKYTNPKVLRSGINVEEGEILRNSDLDTTAVRIANFAPIERVDVTTVPQGTDGAKVVLEVAEKPRWTTEVGAGWSTERGAQARFGIRDDNLIGRGLNLNLRGRWDQTEWLGFVVASLPPLPGKRISLDDDRGIFPRRCARRPEPDPGRAVLVIRGDALDGPRRHRRRHRRRADHRLLPILADDASPKGPNRLLHRNDQPTPVSSAPAMSKTASIRPSIRRRGTAWSSTPPRVARSSGRPPTTGRRSATGRRRWGRRSASTWVQSLRVGVAEPLQGQPLIRTAKFFAGGQGSIRGFDRDSVGPVVDAKDDEFNEIFVPGGGGALLILNEELRIPVWGGLRAALFADIGQVWPSWGEADWSLAVGAGVGIRWATPIGPVWADVAWPVVNPYINPPGEPPY